MSKDHDMCKGPGAEEAEQVAKASLSSVEEKVTKGQAGLSGRKDARCRYEQPWEVEIDSRKHQTWVEAHL